MLIVSDDQGYNDLGVLNEELISPNLDRLAHEGVRLTSFYVAWPACTPSRGAFLTGRYPQRNGLYDMIRNEAPDYGHEYTPEEYAVTWERIGGMDTREVLLPEVLQQAGYRCGVFGKWDMGMSRRFLPLQRGFDDFYGFVNSGIDYFTHERYGVHAMYEGNEPTRRDQGVYCTELFEREALRFLDENHERPFFLYLPFNAPHGASNLDPAVRSAAQAPEEYKEMYPHLEDELVPGRRYGEEAMVAGPSKRKLEYLAAITCMDDAIGSVLDRLDEYGLSENTIVVFFSDNGGGGSGKNKPLRGGKGNTFEGGARVCSIVRYPPRIDAGTVSDEFLTSLELFPTLVELAGADAPDGVILDGYDMLPTLAEGESSPREEMFWKRRDHEGARVGDWKWVRNGTGTFLFDLSEDIGETNNLVDDEPERAVKMRERFEGWLAEMDAAEPRGPFKDY
ncbi:MAG: N-acetylgalactosamine-6-sulfatase [Planctomycetota bacterium]|nr:MAG: N-acetylgalactosamine-6-sulfatase [Planctomycetota bacterium]REJ93160.1 MAG: N-acetylgalactosamine-6-sulfatase [Planctomycetota bacterium]REK30135.1 MAG: N-acetylgalactosamine-6-sulfatase [Planctomycetota bacterium]REK37758.1 MAG: N-acetylgalactosamine-6-sulfatase [Planctomycetota bacterium]